MAETVEGGDITKPLALRVICCGDAVEAAMSNLSFETKERVAKATEAHVKKSGKVIARADRERIKKLSATVVLRRYERNKRKHTISIGGLEAFDLDLKKVAKELGKKFACGSSVTKNANGQDEVVVQGDLSDEIFSYIVEKYPVVPADNIEQVEDKKKKVEAT